MVVTYRDCSVLFCTSLASIYFKNIEESDKPPSQGKGNVVFDFLSQLNIPLMSCPDLRLVSKVGL